MPKNGTKKPSKVSPKTKPWWDESNLVEVIDQDGEVVNLLFPFVEEVKKTIKEATPVLKKQRQVRFIGSKRDLDFFEMYPPSQESRDIFS